MKTQFQTLYVIILMTFFSCPMQTVIKDKNDFYLQNGVPFTGHVAMVDDKGNKEEGEVIKGLRNGLWTYWYSNRIKMERNNFKNGKRDGEDIFWDEHGAMRLRGFFKDDTIDGTTIGYYENGDKTYISFYQKGRKVGTWIEWNRDGSVKSSTNYDMVVEQQKPKLFETAVICDSIPQVCTIYGPFYNFSLIVPKGWYANDSNAIEFGSAVVFMPQGESWPKSQAMIFSCTGIFRDEQIDLMTFIKQQAAHDSTLSPSFSIKSIEPFSSNTILVRSSTIINETLIAYIKEENHIVILKLTSTSVKDFKSSLNAFYSLVKSYMSLY